MDLLIAISTKMLAPALFLGVVAIVWLLVTDYYDRKDAREMETQREHDAFTSWESWDWPIPEDNDSWNFPDRDAA